MDLFAIKSSRIVRAMLHEPKRGWKLYELAKHPDVQVSTGLASKVKHALIEENYALERDRLLYLKQPHDLLTAWTRSYRGPADRCTFYMRGEIAEIEQRVANWCEKTSHAYALAKFSAAWRLAPEVRYSVASVYVDDLLQRPGSLASFCAQCDAKEVDSGANLVLLAPFDKSVFVRCASVPERITSPLQTYLDLAVTAGRAAEAARSIYEKCLRDQLESTGTETSGA